MKKVKGFTLIELLAVILILGIITLIAIPTINNIINESKKNSFKSTIDNLIKAVEQQCQVEKIHGEAYTNEYIFNDSKVVPNLDVEGALPEIGTITISNDCEVSLINLLSNQLKAVSNDNGIIISEDNSKKSYDVGDVLYFDPASNKTCNQSTFEVENVLNETSTCFRWRVIETEDSESNNEILIMLDHNLVNTTVWAESLATTGPTIAMAELNNKTTSWIKVSNLSYIYNTENATNNYGIFNCENGHCSFKDTELYGVKARMITGEEITKIVNTKVTNENAISKKWTQSSVESGYYFFSNSKHLMGYRESGTGDDTYFSWLIENTSLSSESNATVNVYGDSNNGYWTLTPVSNNERNVWRVKNNGNLYNQNVDDNIQYGVRPVIKVFKFYIS